VILVTGASGFVGAALVSALAQSGLSLRACSRAGNLQKLDGVEVFTDIDLTSDFNCEVLLRGISVVIHTAARVHMLHDTAVNSMLAYRLVNTDATLRLAREAANRGVRRFIFLSSIKVNGEATPLGKPFTADSLPLPQDAYGQSKLEAEVGLLQIAEQTGMEVVIIRPPLVYGPGVKANFARMINWVKKGRLLPFGGVTSNRRSMVGIDNLIDLIIVCVKHPAAANQVFLVSDDEDLSTSDLLLRLAAALRRPACLINVPEPILLWGAKLIGQQMSMQRLLGSLQVDIAKTKNLLEWLPVLSMDEGLGRAVAGRDKKIGGLTR
jgi:nucleoside-diphosphate-sugar epimerase